MAVRRGMGTDCRRRGCFLSWRLRSLDSMAAAVIREEKKGHTNLEMVLGASVSQFKYGCYGL
jgi:hypothetical protein